MSTPSSDSAADSAADSPARSTHAERRRRFADLHEASALFLLPNAWDVGSARILAALGFPAIATTSAGHAWSLGKGDQQVTRDELVEHVRVLAAAVDLPVNVDAERCFAAAPAAIAETVGLLAEAGAAGLSIEDYDPARQAVDALPVAVERVAAAAAAAHAPGVGLVLTARAERHLYGAADLDETIARLRAFREAGADVLYAPGLTDREEIARLVAAVGAPVNVLAMQGGPTVAALAAAGVRRVSTGGALARVAYGALVEAAVELRDAGTAGYLERGPAGLSLNAVMGGAAL